MRVLTKTEKKCFSLLDNSRIKQISNSVPIRTKEESMKHFLKKCEIAYKLVNDGKIIFVECLFKENSLRPDIFDITTGTIIEIQNTETDSSIEHKRKIYNSLGLDFIVCKI